MVYSHDGKTLATASEDQTARLWNTASGLARGEAMHHRGAGHVSSPSPPNGTTLVTASADGMVRLWDGATGQPRGVPFEHGKPLKSIVIAPDGKYVASLDDEGTVILWDLANSRRRAPHRTIGQARSRRWLSVPMAPHSLAGAKIGCFDSSTPRAARYRAASTSFVHGGAILDRGLHARWHPDRNR